jgi:hypothetical protein
MNEDKIENYLKKIFIGNIVIMALFTLIAIISIIQYINNPLNYDYDYYYSHNIIGIITGKIYYGISIIYYVKIIFEFIVFIIYFVNDKIKKSKLKLLLIPQTLFSIIFVYICLVNVEIGFPLFIMAICIPPGQILWINFIQNKILLVISIVLSAMMSLFLFYGIFTTILNV